MNRRGRNVVATLLCILASLYVAAPQAQVTPQALLDAGGLEAALLVETEGPLYRRAPFILAVEISTPRWFTRGTRVADIRIADALVLPVSAFAVNETRRRGNESWTVQRWRFRVYPQRSGLLAIPTVRVWVSVSLDAADSATGDIVLQHPPVTVTDPPGLAGDTGDWVATDSLTVGESWDGRRDEYRTGDAISRHRRFVINEAPAMLLSGSETPVIAGLSLYAAPARIEDRSDRGRLSGIREETLVVTMEEPGHYELPGVVYPWFNTRTRQMEVATLPAYAFSVVGAVSSADSPAGGHRATAADRWPWPALSAALIVIGAALAALRSSRLRRRAAVVGAAIRDRRAYRSAIGRGDWPGALALLTAHASRAGTPLPLFEALGDDASAAQTLRALLAGAYGGAGVAPSAAAATALWRAVGRRSVRTANRSTLRLNPAASTSP